jgi:hypothetical protein
MMDVRETVLAELGRIEPRLLEFALQAPSGSIDVCEQVFESPVPAGVRANAVLLACILEPDRGLTLARRAAAEPAALLRIASLRALESLSSDQVRGNAVDILSAALTDHDGGVRKYALRVFRIHKADSLMPLVKQVADSDRIGFLRDLATAAMKR